MAIDKQAGWVLVPRNEPDFILAFTFCAYRRDAIAEMQRTFPTYSRRQILRRWKPVKAVRDIFTNVSGK